MDAINATTTTPPLKRTRAKRSCDFCRQRKSRCDADTSTPCSNCRAWGYKCEFQTVRKKRGPPSVYVDNLEKRCKKMEQLLMTLTNTSIKDLELNDFRPTHKRNISDPNVTDSSSEEEEEDNCHDDIESDNNNNAINDDNDDDDLSTTTMMNRLQRLNIDDYDSIKYTGQSAGLQLMDHANLFKTTQTIPWPGRENDIVLQKIADDQFMVVRTEKSSNGKLDTRLDVGLSINTSIIQSSSSPPSSNIQQLIQTSSIYSVPPNLNNKINPSKHTMDKMIQLYFTQLHPYFPIVNKNRFLQLYQNNDSQLPNVLLNAILALSFRFSHQHVKASSSSSTTTPIIVENAKLYAEYYFRKVMKKIRDSIRSRLCHVQAGLLMTMYLDMDSGDVDSIQWHVLGKSIRMAQDLGLHRSCKHWKLPPSEIETRHRVFFACYILDRWIGARAGKPLTILDRDFDTTIPSPYEINDDDNNDNNNIDSTINNDKKNTKMPIYRVFVLWIKLTEILGRVLKALYAPSAKISNENANLDDPTILVVFNRRLSLWKASLDESLNDFFLLHSQKVTLQVLYNTVVLLLHRPFHQLSLSQYPLLENIITSSRQTCLETISETAQLIKNRKFEESYGSYLLPTCYVYAMFLSSLVHLTIVIDDKSCQKNQQELTESIDLLQNHQHLYTSKRAIEILNMLISLYDLNDKKQATLKIEENTAVSLHKKNSNDNINGMNHTQLPDQTSQQRRIRHQHHYSHDNLSIFLAHSSQQQKQQQQKQYQQQKQQQHHQQPFRRRHQHHHSYDDIALMISQQPYQPQQQHSTSTTQHFMAPAIVQSDILNNEMPKANWFQRMINTSVVGGIPLDIHRDVEMDLSHHHHPPTTYDSSPTNSTNANFLTSPRLVSSPPSYYQNSQQQQQSHILSSTMDSSTSTLSSLSTFIPNLSLPEVVDTNSQHNQLIISTTTAPTTTSSLVSNVMNNNNKNDNDSTPTSSPFQHQTPILNPSQSLPIPTIINHDTTHSISPANLNWHDWQFYMNQQHHNHNHNHNHNHHNLS